MIFKTFLLRRLTCWWDGNTKVNALKRLLCNSCGCFPAELSLRIFVQLLNTSKRIGTNLFAKLNGITVPPKFGSTLTLVPVKTPEISSKWATILMTDAGSFGDLATSQQHKCNRGRPTHFVALEDHWHNPRKSNVQRQHQNNRTRSEFLNSCC